MNESKVLGEKFLNFVGKVLIPINIIGWGIASLVVLVSWNDLGNAAPSLLITKIVNLGVAIALYIGLKSRDQWAWWLLMATLVFSPVGSTFSRYQVQEQKTKVYNLYAERYDKKPISTDPTPLVIMGLLAFCFVSIPCLVYFYNRRSWFDIDFNLGTMATTGVSPEKTSRSNSTPSSQNFRKASSTCPSSGNLPETSPPNPSILSGSSTAVKSEVENGELYAKAYCEAQNESAGRDLGLWAMAFAQNEGDSARSQAEYVRLRVASLAKERQESLKEEERQRARQIAEEQEAETEKKIAEGAIRAQQEAEERQYNAERAILEHKENEFYIFTECLDTSEKLEHLPLLLNYKDFHADTGAQAMALNERFASALDSLWPTVADEIRAEIARFAVALDSRSDALRCRPKYVKWYKPYLEGKDCASNLPSAWLALVKTVRQRYEEALQAFDFSNAIWYAGVWRAWEESPDAAAAQQKSQCAFDAFNLVSHGIVNNEWNSTVDGLEKLISLFGSDSPNLSVSGWEGSLSALLNRARALAVSRERRFRATVLSCVAITGMVVFGSVKTVHHFEQKRVSLLITSTVLPHLLSPTNALDAARSAMLAIRATSKNADSIFASILQGDLTKRADSGDAAAATAIAWSYRNGFGFTTNHVKAATWYRKAADQGYATAQFNLGSCYYYGNGVPIDMAEAVKWYKKAAEQGDATAQFNLGICYANGDGVPIDKTEAVKWYTKAAEQGHAKAQFDFGVCYDNGDGVPIDKTEAVKWYRKAAEQGDAEAQCNLGVCYANGSGVSIDKVEAVKWYRKAAEQGHAEGQFDLGICYYDGNGVLADKAEAVKWYRKAAEQGSASAQSNLAICYGKGDGVPIDKAEAVKWFRKAVTQGNVIAQFNLGVCYDNGEGMSVDKAEAVKWYRKAAEQGHVGAQFNLGYCYYYGKGVYPDKVEAVKWYRKAAEQGDINAQFNLGYCYSYGNGVPADKAEAVKWYCKAAEQGYAAAQLQLGVRYDNGEGMSVDKAEAVKWYRKAAEQGYSAAQFNLGYCYSYGNGVPADKAEAVKWYRKAAEQGLAVAQWFLGNCYYDGKGVPADKVEAVKWYRKAAEQGHAEAKKSLNDFF